MIGPDERGGVRIKGTVPQRQLARTLRGLREEAGLTLEEAAPKLDWSTSKLSRIETAQQGVDVHGVRSMLDLYNIGGAQWAEIVELTREAKQKGWWHAYGFKIARYVASGNAGSPRIRHWSWWPSWTRRCCTARSAGRR